MCTYFKTETEDHSTGRSLSEKKYGDTGLVSEKTETLYAELNERVEATNSSYSTTSEFLKYIYSVLVAKNHQKIRSRCLVHEFSVTDIFLIPFYMAVASYCYYEKVRRTIGTAIVSYLLKYFHFFSAAELNILRVSTKFLLRNFHTKRVIMEIAMMKIFNNCISGRLNNNYFPLNESSSLY